MNLTKNCESFKEGFVTPQVPIYGRRLTQGNVAGSSIQKVLRGSIYQVCETVATPTYNERDNKYIYIYIYIYIYMQNMRREGNSATTKNHQQNPKDTI